MNNLMNTSTTGYVVTRLNSTLGENQICCSRMYVLMDRGVQILNIVTPELF